MKLLAFRLSPISGCGPPGYTLYRGLFNSQFRKIELSSLSLTLPNELLVDKSYSKSTGCKPREVRGTIERR